MVRKGDIIFGFLCIFINTAQSTASAVPEEDLRCVLSLRGRDWSPIRIGLVFDVPEPTASTYVGLMDLIQERIFPRISSFWSHAMTVPRMRTPFLVSRECRVVDGVCVEEMNSVCGARSGMSIPIPAHVLSSMTVHERAPSGEYVKRTVPAGRGADVDFMLLVTVEDRPNCGNLSSGMIASAVACRWDSCQRPLMGAVNICPRAVDPVSEESITSLFSTLTHEMTHVFGFTADAIANMRQPNGIRRLPVANRVDVYYTCRIVDGELDLVWDIDPRRYTGPNLHRYVFPDGLVVSTTARGTGRDCRCPLSSRKRYSARDVRHCLKHKHECSFTLVTPRVAAMAKAYFGCPQLQGAELENQTGGPNCHILESHWKERLFGHEIMTSTSSTMHSEVSPLTFAFLEDTGWYRMNYMMTTSLLPGASFGFKAGCAFVQKRCVSSRGNLVKQAVDAKAFCSSPSVDAVCSPDGTHKVTCNARSPEGRTIPQNFQYPIVGSSMYDDFCPRFVTQPHSLCRVAASGAAWELFGPSSRCLDVTADGSEIGSCVHVACSSRAKSYRVTLAENGETVTLRTKCKTAGQIISYNDKSITCLDPRIVCSVRDFPHIASPMVSTVAGAVHNLDSRIEAKSIADAINQGEAVIVYSSSVGALAVLSAVIVVAVL